MIERHWDGIAAYCRPENKVSLGFVEGLNNKVRVFERPAYGLKYEFEAPLMHVSGVLKCDDDPHKSRKTLFSVERAHFPV
jgi:hypothetical protein